MAEAPKTFFKKQAFSLPKPVLLLGGLSMLLVLGVVFFSSERAGREKTAEWPQDSASEQKTVYSKAEIENLIKEQLSREKEEAEKVKPAAKPEVKKRKLNTEIAVYLKKQETGEKKEKERKEKEPGVPTGTKIKAHLSNAIFSFNVTSPVIAVTDEDFLKDHTTIIPKGTQFIGEAGIVQSRDRVNVKFYRAVLPDGSEMHIRAMALGLDGSGGIKGKVDKQYDRSILKAAGEMVLSGASLVLGTRNSGAMTLEDEVRLNASRNLADDAQEALNGIKIEQSISVDAYTPILILFLETA